MIRSSSDDDDSGNNNDLQSVYNDHRQMQMLCVVLCIFLLKINRINLSTAMMNKYVLLKDEKNSKNPYLLFYWKGTQCSNAIWMK